MVAVDFNAEPLVDFDSEIAEFLDPRGKRRFEITIETFQHFASEFNIFILVDKQLDEGVDEVEFRLANLFEPGFHFDEFLKMRHFWWFSNTVQSTVFIFLYLSKFLSKEKIGGNSDQ